MRLSCENTVLRSIRPSEEERMIIRAVADEIICEVNKSGIATGMVVGSVARDTWVSGDKDLDIFMLFSPEVSREELEEKGLGLARQISKTFSGVFVEKYAEHPYINANIRGFDIDLVPCYAVESASMIKSAVDRTPFHTRYIKEKISGHTDDVLLLKQFSKACGVYGSDQMTEGFAGYLCELLICYYGGFTELLEEASKWRPGIVIDIEKHQAKELTEPLVVIDPVDPCRNVAASLSATRMCEFAEFARGYLKNPSEIYFEAPVSKEISSEDFKTMIEDRGSSFYAVVFKTPGLIPDIVVPQLRRSAIGINGLLERNGFVVNRFDCSMKEENCMILYELLVDQLPNVEKREGPPVWNAENSDKFLKKHIGNTFAGPYIENERYYVEIERKYPDVYSILLSGEILSSGLGKHVRKSIENEMNIYKDEECWSKEFSDFLGDFVMKKSPLIERMMKQTESLNFQT
ncbi:CCA tRNA nucleotidyltransferase [Methanoplanus sp. FWC-SCC4]|uniref:CCA-adding enzyme n=1 Tax=Methanochimaera problematica TaxID=2609417 RepID=A0AA97FCV0_9EURY|nr:CCA tRNA nucleotidyltransferase [Methanoplanus sp. FWC-SCC4]WOF16187.1 CCA tRNA nucleotidyltransferase [Methanoplanus sp. FWC-SCC4]